MQLIKQPLNSMLCGQACIAMYLGITLEQSIKEFGHEHGTYTRELVAVLRRFNKPCGSKLVRVSLLRPLPITCILRLIFKSDGKILHRHWVLMVDGQFFDPGHGRLSVGRISAYLELG